MPRWLKIILLLLAGLLLAVATLPWWAGVAARPLLKRWDVTLVNYRAEGFSRFQVDELRYARGNTTVIARGVEANSPFLWLKPGSRQASAKDWSVEVKPSAKVSGEIKPSSIDGMPALHALLFKISRILNRWLPTAVIGPGTVRWPRGGLTLASATWKDRTLSAKDVRLYGQAFDAEVDLAQDGVIKVHAIDVPHEIEARVAWTNTTVAGTASCWKQPVQLSARYDQAGWLPLEALARADQWIVPAERARIGAQYAQLTGGGTLTWRDKAFAISVHAKALPKENIKAPALEGHLEATGDREALTITGLQLDAPFARARLSAPVVLDFNGQARGAPASLSLEADLAKQSWVEARGLIKGAVVVSAANTSTKASFDLSLERISVAGYAVQQAQARGTWQWPQLVLSELTVQLDETSRAKLAGIIDWQQRRLENVTVEATVKPAWFARWLPAGVTWENAILTGTLTGPFEAVRHAGELQATHALAGPLKPFDLAATWRGEGRTLAEFTADLAAQKSLLHVAGKSDARGIELAEFRFAPAGTEVLALSAPARIEWSPSWRFTNLSLQGPAATITLAGQGGTDGTYTLAATNLDKEWIHDWLDLRGPTWRVRQLQAEGRTVDHLFHFSSSLAGEIHLPGRAVAQVLLTARGDAEGVELTDLKISESGQVLTQATGRLPLTWTVDAVPHLRSSETAPLELKADVQPASPIWAALAEPAHLTLTGASAQAQLSGNLKEPQGHLRVTVEGLKVADDSRWRSRVPDVAGFSLVASADRAQVRLESLTARIEGQELKASALLPMDDGRWRDLLANPSKFDWREAEGRLEIPGFDLAPLARRLSQFPMALGRLQARVELARGGSLHGSLQLTDAATRPIPALGVIQEITAALSFSGRDAKIDSFAARLGGEPVELSGTIGFPAGEAPQPKLKLSGKNLPLVRRAGLLVRSDLDLRTESTRGGSTRLAGVVNLRDVLVLSDLSSLLPTGVRGVRRQPPYFSVDAEPFSHWPLAVELRGPSAIRMRTPFFTGTATAHFSLTGTLGEPRAIGEVTVEDGKMFFPFATFTVQNGAIRLRAADPFTPELTLNAISRRHSYELRLEATGSPEAPSLIFSSNPPLEASQVLLMVMAGQMPADETAGTTASGGLRLTQLGAYLGQGIYRGLGGTGENRLEIVSGEQISRLGRETYEIEYKLGEHWSLVGEYDEFDSYNGGVKWRIYTQGGPDAEK